MKSRALESVTADLFAAATEVQHTPPATVRTPAALQAPERASRGCPRHLWYAVVFAQLNEAESSALMLRRLALHAQKFTSWVSIEMPNALLLEIRGSKKLFGSLETLHADLDAVWNRLKLDARSAAAPSSLAALWLARAGCRVLIEDPGQLAGVLAPLPVACTAWDAERLGTLRAMGVMRVGELLRLPRAGIARRFGPAAVLDLDQVLARQAAPRRAFVPRERFRERCDFESEVETVEYLLKALEPLMQRCARFLRERQAGVQALELRLHHRAEPVSRVSLGLASITSERRRLSEVLTQKLSRLELAAPVVRMELLSGALQPLSPASVDVFAHLGGALGRDTAPQLVERLRARLGERAVYGIGTVAEHRPEAAWQRIHALRLDAVLRAGDRIAEAFEDMPRPVWLLDEPTELEASKVLRLRQAKAFEGPERIESGWWDGKGVARDYYVVRPRGGARLWVFQERRSKCWYLHGVFA